MWFTWLFFAYSKVNFKPVSLFSIHKANWKNLWGVSFMWKWDGHWLSVNSIDREGDRDIHVRVVPEKERPRRRISTSVKSEFDEHWRQVLIYICVCVCRWQWWHWSWAQGRRGKGKAWVADEMEGARLDRIWKGLSGLDCENCFNRIISVERSQSCRCREEQDRRWMVTFAFGLKRVADRISDHEEVVADVKVGRNQKSATGVDLICCRISLLTRLVEIAVRWLDEENFGVCGSWEWCPTLGTATWARHWAGSLVVWRWQSIEENFHGEKILGKWPTYHVRFWMTWRLNSRWG